MTVSTSPVRTPLVIPYTDLYIWIVQYDRVYQSREDTVGDSVYRVGRHRDVDVVDVEWHVYTSVVSRTDIV